MGKIDKEKLLREIHCKGTGNFNGSGCCNGCNNYNEDHNTTGECLNSVIKNFPEEPEIDFDVLYKEYLGSVQFGSIPTAWQFRNFLKSKNLTQPQVDMDALRNEIYASIQKPSEIPVKKTWSLKKHVGEIFHDFGNSPYPFTSDPPENLIKYYNLHEEPDYSKIPKGSIVEVTGKIDTNNRIVDYFKKHENGFLFLGFTTVKADLFNIRIVELAKEKV